MLLRRRTDTIPTAGMHENALCEEQQSHVHEARQAGHLITKQLNFLKLGTESRYQKSTRQDTIILLCFTNFYVIKLRMLTDL